MPGMTGVEFLRTVKTLYPDTVRLVLSGFTELQSVTDAVNEGAIYKFLTKPWDDTQLRAHVSEAFAHKEMSDENQRLDREVRSANFSLAEANRQLEQALRQQRDQSRQDAITLDIVREALQQVPLPIVGLDEDELVAFANVSAFHLLGDGAVLGMPAAELMPDVLAQVRAVGDGHACEARLGADQVRVVAHGMGRGTRARGRLITFLDVVAAAERQHG
jgi:CheY-like chemotaxis protein